MNEVTEGQASAVLCSHSSICSDLPQTGPRKTAMLSITKVWLALLLVTDAASADGDVSGHLRHESRSLAATYTYTSQYSAAMLTRVNEQRASQGLRALCMNTKLMAASKGHSTDMASNNFMSHTGSDGSTMSMRVSATGYKWTRVAENVAAGQITVDAVMKSWMNSAGHRANILGDYTMFGTAYAYSSGSTYKHYWTQNFAKSSTESCDYEDAEYIDSPTLNSTTDSTDNSSVVLPNDSTPEVNATAKPDCKVAL